MIRSGDTFEEKKAFYEKYHYSFIPFIPLKDPERKLKDLDFSFKYPENTEKIDGEAIRPRGIRPYWVYTVQGLRKAKTRKERLMAMRFSVGEKALPILDKMLREEREQLLGSIRRKAK